MPRPEIPKYGAPEDVLVILIHETVYGPPERRLAANFILDCLRRFQNRDEIETCLRELEAHAILDVAAEARKLASGLNLIG